MERISKALVVFMLIWMAACGKPASFTEEEQKIIGSVQEGIMPVYTIDKREDSVFLRKEAQPLDKAALESAYYQVLKQRMLLTVNDTANPGVGIAAPQVGIGRQLIAVQRFDKIGEPFEFYVNPVITSYSSEQIIGPEGCLSVPDRMDSVGRSAEIVVNYLYTPEQEKKEEKWIWKQDTVKGFTAVIFQHEIDHLHGILFIDRVAGNNK